MNNTYGDLPDGFGEVANRLGILEALSMTQLRPVQVQPFRRLLAESMARLIGDRDEKKALEVLDKAETYLKARGNENTRSWYIRWAAPVSKGLIPLDSTKLNPITAPQISALP